jgi:hypothetical protein
VRLFSYVVARDYGFAPNPFYGVCTLATCKPGIRGVAAIGDWVVGTGTARRKRAGYLVYAMKVEEALTFDQYWADARFLQKRPNLRGSKKQAFGDNIYHRANSKSPWMQEDSHHSLANGAANPANIKNDTRANRILTSSDFAYWGKAGPRIPAKFRNYEGVDLCAGRGHKQKVFTEAFIDEFAAWFRGLSVTGYRGLPIDWDKTP